MSTSRRTKPSGTGTGAVAVNNSASARPKPRTTTPVSERLDPFNTGKENTNNSAKITSRPSRTKPFVPQIVKTETTAPPRARWSSSVPRGRSVSPCQFSRVDRPANGGVNGDVRKTRVSRVSNERSVSVDRSARVRDRVGLSNARVEKSEKNLVKKSEKFEMSEKNDQMRAKNVKDEKGAENKANVNVRDEMRAKNVKVEKAVEKSETGSDSVMKVSESVKMFERFKSKSSVGLRASNGSESEESGVRLSFGGSSGRLSKGTSSSSSDGSSVKYPSKLHGKLAFLEEKVKRIASDIKRTKEMLDLNNPDASKVMLSDIQETVAGIEKAMGDVVSGEKEKKNVEKKNSPIKESSDVKSLAKGLNNDELEARLFPHHKLLRDRTTLKAPLGSHESIKTKVAVTVIETKQDEKPLSDVVENCKAIVLLSDSSSKLESKVTKIGGLELCEVQETEESGANSRARDSFNSGKGNDVPMLAADETLEDFDDEENKPVMVFDVEFDDSGNDQLNEIGNKTCTGGWFLSEGESALLAHDDGSCSFYDVVNSEVKSVYKPPAGLSPNLWRDCWIVRALGADGCSARYVVAASAGNSMDSGFCSWDFYTREIKSFHIEDGVTNTRTALAPLSNNALNRRHDLSNLTPENRQWWYKPCGPLIVTTASNQKVVKVFDIRDGEHIMKWDVQNHVVAMDNSSPLQWRNRGKVVLAETENVSLWDVGSLTPEPLLTVSSSGKKITALHVNNTDAELGGGVRQRVSSSEAEGNDGVFCTSDSINVLDFRHPSGIGLRIPKYGNTVHSVFSRGDSIYLGCSGSSSTTRKLTTSSQIQQFSLRRQKLFSTYMLPESNAHPHYKAITQVWGNSNLTMGVSGLGLFVFDALKDDGSRPLVSDYGSGQKLRETIGPDNLYSPSFDYLGSRALLISRDRPACWKYLS